MDSENNPQPTEEMQPEVPEQEQPETPEEPPTEEPEAKADDAEADSESEGDGGEEESKPGEDKHRRKTGSQRNRERLEREREQWAQERAFYQAQLAQRTPPQQPGGAEAPKPTPEQQLQEYLGTMVQQGVHQVLAQRDQESAAQQLEQKWQEQLPADEDESQEVRAFISKARTGLRPGPVKEALLTSEFAPKIIASLIRNPRELARLSALPEGQAAREIGRLEAQFAAGAAPVKPKSAIRPPVPPTNVGGSSASTRNLDDLPFPQWKKALRSKGK